MQNPNNIVPITLSIPIDDNGTAATGTITSNNTDVANNDTVTINGRVYTFKTTLTGAVDEVLRGVTDADTTLTALRTIINSGRAAAAASTTLTSNGTNVTAADTVTIGAKTYTFKTALTEKKATGTLTSDNTNVSAGDTVTIDTTIYTFVASLSSNFHGALRPLRQPNQILIGADADTSLNNLIAAINGASGEGTAYSLNTVAHPTVTAGTVSAHAFAVTAKSIGTASNSIATTETSSHLSWGGSTLATGAASTANEVLRGADAATSLANLKAAINGASGAGTTYSTATVASTEVTAGTLTDTTLAITAQATGTAGNSLASTKSAATLSFTGSTLAGGITASTPNADVTCSAVASHVLTLTSILTTYAANSITLAKSSTPLTVSGGTLTGGGSTIGTYTVPEIGGLLHTITSIAPNWSGSPTYTIALLDSSARQYYVTGSLNENATTNTDIADQMISAGDVVKVTTIAKVEGTLPLVVRLS